jgi:Methyltransferase FkbM domain
MSDEATRAFLVARRGIGLLPNRPKRLCSVVAYRFAERETRGRGRIRLAGKAEGEGVELDLDLADWLQRLYALGGTDTEPRSALRALLPRGGVFVDAGANIGLYTCTVAAHVGSSGHVLAFEPVPENLDALRRNVRLNPLGNVSVLPVGALRPNGSPRAVRAARTSGRQLGKHLRSGPGRRRADGDRGRRAP